MFHYKSTQKSRYRKKTLQLITNPYVTVILLNLKRRVICIYLASLVFGPAAALAKLTGAALLAGVDEAGKPGKFGVLDGWRRWGESIVEGTLSDTCELELLSASDTLPDDLFRFLNTILIVVVVGDNFSRLSPRVEHWSQNTFILI